MTGLMLLQIEISNSAFILLIQIWLQHSVWAARDNLIGGYLHRPVYGIILWCWWSWLGGVWKFLFLFLV